MNINEIASKLGKKGGKSGFGACKRRSIEHYKRMAELSWKDKRLPIEVRFWMKVKKGDESQCWIWTGCKTPNGYGCFNVNNRMKLAPRIAWELTHGEKPNLCVLHHCDNPSCCNPKHLFLGTQKDNLDDCRKKGRAKSPKGENHRSAKLTEKNVINIRNSNLTVKQLIEKYRVSESTIRHVVNRRTWKHIASTKANHSREGA